MASDKKMATIQYSSESELLGDPFLIENHAGSFKLIHPKKTLGC
jgi:hypothetical protein